MKRLFARLVLWLIRPALDLALRDETRQGGVAFSNRTVISVVQRHGALSERIDTVIWRPEAAGDILCKGGLT
jgi:hypothetical protein